MTGGFDRLYWNAFLASHTLYGARLMTQPLEKIVAVQSRRVRSLVHYAYSQVPHYREVMDRLHLRPEEFRNAKDLERLPVLSKEELLDAPERFVGAEFRNGEGLTLRSSGTSGRARTIVYDSKALFLALANGYRQRRALASLVGKSVGYREIDLSRDGSLGSQLRGFYERHSWVPRGIDLHRQLISPSEPFDSIREKINEFRPDVIRGYGSLLGAFFRWMHERDLTLTAPKAVHYGGDRMAEADRRLIEDEFKIPVFSTYQAAEALLIAFQCKRRQGFHISLDQVAIRVIDPQGRSVEAGGTGELILSNLTNRGTVLINLRLGDLVTLGNIPCDCGCPLPVIDNIEGRADDLISIPGGSVIHALSMLPPLQSVEGVVQLQLEQQELRKFQMRVVCSKEADWQSTRAGLRELLFAVLGEDSEIQLERVDRIIPELGGKVKGVISRPRI